MGEALLINPSYFRTYGSNQGGIAFPIYPILSLSAIDGALKARGHQVKILDLSYRRYDPRMLRDIILAEKPDAVGITATTPLANQMRDISFLVKDISSDILAEVFWNVYYTLKFFWFTVVGNEQAPEKERYEFEDRWRPLDTRPDAELHPHHVPKAKSGASRRKALAE